MITKIHYRDYDEDKWHHRFRSTLTAAIRLAEKRLKDHPQSIVIEHEGEVYTVYFDNKGLTRVERL